MIFCPVIGGMFRITQKFGVNPQEYKKYGLTAHNGTDISPFIRGMSAPIVYAPHDGWVTRKNEGGTGYGKYVMIVSDPYGKDKMQRRSDLAHLETFWVQDGQFVNQGDAVGVMGNTGNSTGLHLHWTYKNMKDGKTLNHDNGYKGALDVWRYVVYWNPTKSL